MRRFKLVAIIILLSFLINLTYFGDIPAIAEGGTPVAPSIHTIYPNYAVQGDVNKQFTILGTNLGSDDITKIQVGEFEINNDENNGITVSDDGKSLHFNIDNTDELAKGLNDVTVTFFKSGSVKLTQAFIVFSSDDELKADLSLVELLPNTGEFGSSTEVIIKAIENEYFLLDSSEVVGEPSYPDVSFDGVSAKVISGSLKELIVEAPERTTAGKVRVTVRNRIKEAFQGEADFWYVAKGEQMRILTITPNRGSTAGGTVVDIHGLNFPTYYPSTDDETTKPDDGKEDTDNRRKYKDLVIRIGGVQVEIVDIFEDEHMTENEQGKVYVIRVVTPQFGELPGPQDVEIDIVWIEEGEERREVAVKPGGFYYYDPASYPVIIDVKNTVTGTNEGPVNGGHWVEIIGTGFRTPVKVYFGRAEVDPGYVILKKDQRIVDGESKDVEILTVPLPPKSTYDAVGPVDVRVENIGEYGIPTGEFTLRYGFIYKRTDMKLLDISPPSIYNVDKDEPVIITGLKFDEDLAENTNIFLGQWEIDLEIAEEDPVYPGNYIITGDTTFFRLRQLEIPDKTNEKLPERVIYATIPGALDAGSWDLIIENSYGTVVWKDAFQVLPYYVIPEICWVVSYESDDLECPTDEDDTDENGGGDAPEDNGEQQSNNDGEGNGSNDSEPKNYASPQGPTSGGTTFKIFGRNFLQGSEVYVGGLEDHNRATIVEHESPNKIIAKSPPGEPGWQSVYVVSRFGTIGEMPADPTKDGGQQGFQYVSTPAIDDVSPNIGSIDGGNIITITGEQFYDGAQVFFEYKFVDEDDEEKNYKNIVKQVEEIEISSDHKTIKLRLPPLICLKSPDNEGGGNGNGNGTGDDGSEDNGDAGDGNGSNDDENDENGNGGEGEEEDPEDPGGNGGTGEGDSEEEGTVGGETDKGPEPGDEEDEDCNGSCAVSLSPDECKVILAELDEHGEIKVWVRVVNTDEQYYVWDEPFILKEPDPKRQPVIKSVSPMVSKTSGGARVIIRGSNFRELDAVHFEFDEAVIISSTDTQIVVLTPPKEEGSYKVTVSNIHGEAAIWDGDFLYLDEGKIRSIESIVPDRGPKDGGTTIMISGGEFNSRSKVWIGGKQGVDVKAYATYIIATTPKAEDPGLVDVMVVNEDGTIYLKENGFMYVEQAKEVSISQVEPSVIPISGNVMVTITGTGFQENLEVYFGSMPAPVVLYEPTRIVVQAPAYPLGFPDTVWVTVMNPDGGVAQSQITYTDSLSNPVITSINPDRGPAAGGNQVVIEGSGFKDRVDVFFGGKKATVESVNPNRIVVIAPAGKPGEAVYITVTNTDPNAIGSYTFDKPYTYEGSKPEIISVVPNQASYEGGTRVTITGQGFTSSVTVEIGEWRAGVIQVVDGETIIIETPRIAEKVEDLPDLTKWWDVKVINADGMEAVKKEAFKFLLPRSKPVIKAVEPNQGPTIGGLIVTIYGTDFLERAQVVIRDKNIGDKYAEVLMVDDTPGEGNGKIVVRIPPHSAGKKELVVINHDGAMSEPVLFEYVTPKSSPEINSVEPNQGLTLGGTEVIITGFGFVEETDGNSNKLPRVWFGINEASEVEFIDYKTLRVITPPGNEGSVDVLVLNPDWGLAVLQNGFRYIAPAGMVIDKIEPDRGTAIGGAKITIRGWPFLEGATVTIGGNPALYVKVENASTIIAETPAFDLGYAREMAVDVTVTNPDGTSATKAGGFTYYKTAPEHPPGWVDTERKDRETIEVSWEEVDFANYYEIWISTTRNGPYRFLDSTDRTVYYATGLDYNTTYYFQIRAVNELGVSDFSYYESMRTGSGRQQEANLVPENIIMETANGNATATIATANALTYSGYRIDFTQPAYQKTNRKAVRISQKALAQSYLPITVEAPGISLSVPGSSIYLGLLAQDEDYAEIIITDLGQQVAERAMRELPRGSRIISPVYEVGWQILKGTGGTPQNKFHQQVQLTMKYNVSVTPGKQVSLYTYNPTTGRWVNTGAAENPSTPQLTLGIIAPGRFMLVEH